MKRIVALLLCLTMGASMLVGCGSKDKGASGKDGDVTLTIGIPQNGNVEDYETNAYTLWLEEQTGYNLEFELFASSSADYQSQIATRIAGGKKLPDLLWYVELGEETYEDYGKDGYLLDLKPYFDDKEKSEIFWTQLGKAYENEKDRDYVINKVTEQESGAIYAFPYVEISVIDTMQYQVFINQTWLDKLGLSMPTDNDSLYNVLKAFANNDPNGNGKKDEIALLGQNSNSYGSNLFAWLTSNFIAANEENWFNVDESGNVYLPWVMDEYREALKYINKLQKEGLVPESCWSMDGTGVKNLVNPTNGVNEVGMFVGHPSIVLEVGNEANYEYASLPLWGYGVSNQDLISDQCFITTDCKNPDAAWELLMTMCTDEGAKRQRYGEKDVDWVEADPDTKSFIGWDAEIKVLNDIWGTQHNQTWGVCCGTILINSENETRQISEDDDAWSKHKMKLMADAYNTHKQAAESKPVTIMPSISRTEEEHKATQVERNNCANYIRTMRAKFCCGTGGADPNNDGQWKKYLSELDNYGIDKWVKQTQEIYDRMK